MQLFDIGAGLAVSFQAANGLGKPKNTLSKAQLEIFTKVLLQRARRSVSVPVLMNDSELLCRGLSTSRELVLSEPFNHVGPAITCSLEAAPDARDVDWHTDRHLGSCIRDCIRVSMWLARCMGFFRQYML